MLHLQKHLLLFRRSASPIFFSLHRDLLSAFSSAAASPGHFAVEDYLVTTCGLTPEQALKAAKYISHRKAPSNADSVLAFLAGPALRLSKADIAHVVAHDPRILNCSVDNTLKVRVASFLSHGLSASQIRSFVRLAPCFFRSFNIHEKLGFSMPFLGSPEKLLLVVKRNFYLLTSDLERVVKPNIELLRECGLSARSIAQLCRANSRLLTRNPKTVKAIIARADELGVPRHSLMFRQAVETTTASTGLRSETMASKLKFLGETLGWSEAEVASAVRKNPVVPRCSRDKLRRVSEFLTTVVGVDAKYILGRPTILMYSLERRLAPRHYVMKVLQGKGLIRQDLCFYTMVTLCDKSFHHKYIHPHKDVLPGLADAYTAACKGKLPAGDGL